MIWVIGGTSDANQLVKALRNKGIDEVLVSTTTDYGNELARKNNFEVIQKALDEEGMQRVIGKYGVDLVIDASHPFAIEVSKNAIVASEKQSVKYCRYEREQIPFDEVHYYDDYTSLMNSLKQLEGNILLTTGAKNIHLFEQLVGERLFARVLATTDSIAKCEAIGLKPHQIIAMNGRVLQDTNKALFKEYQIQHLVMKDSGEAGGMNEKVDAAKSLGIHIHIIKRPQLNYPQVFNSIEEIIKTIKPN